MKRERKEVNGILSLGTLLRVSVLSGFCIGVMFGVFSGVVSYLVNGNFLDLVLIVSVAPLVVALLLGLVTLIGHPLYRALGRLRVLGADKFSYEIIADEV